LHEQIQECFQNFDNYLLQLHQRKTKTQQAVYQEELKIVRMLNDLIVSSEFDRREGQLVTKLDKLRDIKVVIKIRFEN
jgi:hypothetical protein